MPLGKLMHGENLSYKLLKTYITRLVNLELISLEKVGRKWLARTTKHGIEAVGLYQEAISLLNGRKV